MTCLGMWVSWCLSGRELRPLALRLLALSTLVSGLVGTCAHAANVPSRVALIIENSDYANPKDRLPGAVRDAKFIREALEDRKLGFRIISVKNATRASMEAGLKEFMSAMKESGPAGIGFLYYVGHGGADASGTDNFLLPVDVPNVSTAAVASVGLSLRQITERLSYLDKRAAIVVVVDACRSIEPQAQAPSGFAPPDEQQPGFVVALSTSKGHPASDSSPYARLLGNKLVTDGLTVDQVFQQVRQEVAKDTHQRQIPVDQSRLIDTVCLISCGTGGVAVGPYSQNPELLRSAQRSADMWMARLAQSSAESRCASGWKELKVLNSSARQSLDAGNPDTAGVTYTKLAEKAEVVMQYLTVSKMIGDAEQTYRDLDVHNAKRRLDMQRDWYQKFEKRQIEATEHAHKIEKQMNKKIELTQAQALEAEARKLAAAEQYEDATDKMIDALNETRAQQDKVQNYASRPVEHLKRRALPVPSRYNADEQRSRLPPICS